MKFKVLIATKDRPDILLKTLNRIYDRQYDYVISIEFQDINKYAFIRKKYPQIYYLYIPNDIGLSFTRHLLVDYALSQNVDFVWFLDDNVVFKKGDEKKFIEVFMKNDNVYWLAGYAPIFDLYYNKPKGILIPSFGCIGCCFMVKSHFLKEENYDVNLMHYEDVDLIIRLLLKYPGEIHTFWYKNFTYKKKRHMKGGMSFVRNQKDLEEAVKYVNNKYQCEIAYISCRKDKLIHSLKWKKFFEEMLHQEYKRVGEWGYDKKEK